MGTDTAAAKARMAAVMARAVRDSPKTQAEIADELGITQPTISKWLSGDTDYQPWKVNDLEAVLGLRRGELLIRAGFVELPDGSPYESVEYALYADTALDDDDRAAVLRVYSVFRKLGGGS